MEKLVVEVNGVAFTMMPVEGGTFLMGATAEQLSDAWDNESPVRKVSVGNYLMGATVVTQSLWNAVMGGGGVEDGGMPLVGKDWNECQHFILKLNELTGVKFRMATEAEWEFAARGGNLSKGFKYPGSNRLPEVAWFDLNSGSKTHEVGQKAPNELGLFDMAGNVFEWCNDWYGLYDRKDVDHPQGPANGIQRVCRGGSFSYYDRSCRISCRMGLEPCGKNYAKVGFRLVMDEEEASLYLERRNAKEEESENVAADENAFAVPAAEEPVVGPEEPVVGPKEPVSGPTEGDKQEADAVDDGKLENQQEEKGEENTPEQVAEPEEPKEPVPTENLFSDSDVNGFCSWNCGTLQKPVKTKKKRKTWLIVGLILLVIIILLSLMGLKIYNVKQAKEFINKNISLSEYNLSSYKTKSYKDFDNKLDNLDQGWSCLRDAHNRLDGLSGNDYNDYRARIKYEGIDYLQYLDDLKTQLNVDIVRASTEENRLDLEYCLSKVNRLQWNPRELDIPDYEVKKNDDWLLVEANGVKFLMRHVKGGTFEMGSGRYTNEPQHTVTLSSYYIGEVEVTQELWQTVMGGQNPSYKYDPSLPVEGVSWNACVYFIDELNRITGRKFRLPTEAEWEFAARGGVYGNGSSYAGSGSVEEVAWYSGNSNSNNSNSYYHSHFPRGKKSNELDLYDMSGNVFEWCNDWYSSDYYNVSSSFDPQGPSYGSEYVIRGGSWAANDYYCSVSYRYHINPNSWYSDVGLRLAMSE